MSTPLERLLAEELPTGTFGGARPARRPAPMSVTPRTEQARHYAELAAALELPARRPLRTTARPRRRAAR